MPAGRPRKYQNIEELEALIEAYFESCYGEEFVTDNKGNVIMLNGEPVKERKQIEPFTITGLALALDSSREELMNIEESYPEEFVVAIKRAKMRCQNYAERRLFGSIPTGAIFALKNYGWKDTQEFTGAIAMTNYEHVPDDQLDSLLAGIAAKKTCAQNSEVKH